MLRRARLDIGMSHLVEHLVAEIGVQQLVIVAHCLDQPRAIGMAVDAIQRLSLLFGAVENFRKHRVVAAQNAALKITLLPGKVAHSACWPGASTFSATSLVRLTSTRSSASGGILSSRSIMVETRPKRFSAAT